MKAAIYRRYGSPDVVTVSQAAGPGRGHGMSRARRTGHKVRSCA
jgi:hypothetical protein